MKKIFLATTSLIALANGAAVAADMPVKAERHYHRECAADKFSGGYIGVNGGFVNWTANRTDRDAWLIDTSTYVQKKWGGAIGGQIGYNWTTCNTVWGIEIDGNWISANKETRLREDIATVNASINSRLSGLVTARTRAGIVMDNLLLYVTGGVAAVQSRTTWGSNGFNNIPFTTLENSQWSWGFVAGFGSEWKWSDRVSIKSEVLYIETADREYAIGGNVAGIGGGAFTRHFTNSDSMWVTRIGLNYSFGGGKAVVANY